MPDIPVVVLGSGAVGKSCITIQYIQGHFVDRYDATIEDVYRKPVEVDGQAVVLTIVDTAGQDSFGTMREQYMRTGQGFVLVYSITDAESFQHLKKIFAQLRRTKGDGAPISCIVVGNKLDLAPQRAVATEEGQLFARQAGCAFVEISAKDRLHVEDVFTALVRTVRSDAGGGAAPRGGGGGGSGGGADGSGGHREAAAARPGPAAASPAAAQAPNSAAQGGQAGGRSQAAGGGAAADPKKKKKKWKCTML